MSANSTISWTDHTFNPWIGCTKVSPGCDNCYAERREDLRLHRVQWGVGQPRHRTKTWGDPVRWNKQPWPMTDDGTDHRRPRVFCASLADVFDNEVGKGWRQDLFALIRATPNLDWLLLTKRIGNADRMIEDAIADMEIADDPTYTPWPWPNVWIGATVVNQEEADRDIPKLLATPARVRFLSIEPMLGPISFEGMFANPGDMRDGTNALEALDWVIAGGESGPHARPAHPDWFRSLRDQCAASGVPFHFKQWGEWGEPDSIEATGLAHHGWWEVDRDDGGVPRHEWPGPMLGGVELASQRPEVFRVGKKAAGRLLDGVEHNGFPA